MSITYVAIYTNSLSAKQEVTRYTNDTVRIMSLDNNIDLHLRSYSNNPVERTCNYPVCNHSVIINPAIHPNPIAARAVIALSVEAAPVLLGVGVWRLDVVLATALPPPAAPVLVVVDLVEVVRERPAVWEGV